MRCLLGFVLAATALPPACLAQETVSFQRDVAPILAQNCTTCHSSTQQMSSLDLSSRAGALKGGQKNGPAIIPGNSAKSPLYLRLTGAQQPTMPLNGKLPPAAIAIIQKWLDSGAVWDAPITAAPAGPPNAPGSEKKFSDQDRNWWAFRKPVRPALPKVHNPAQS